MNSIKKIWNKTIAYYLVMATITVFIFSEFIIREPFATIANVLDEMKIKYILMAITSFYIIILLISRRTSLFKNGVFKKEAKLYLIAIGSLGVITFIYQIINGFRTFVIPEFMYVLLPLIFVILVVSADCINITRVLDNGFYIVVTAFILDAVGAFNSASSVAFDFSESASPFENPSSMVFILFELYFLIRYGKRNGKSLVCLVLTILTLKRVSVIMAVLFFVIVPIIKDKKIPRWIFGIAIIFFCAAPFLLELFYSNEFATIFLARYNIDFNDFTMDRYARTSYVLNNSDQIKYGFGSISHFLSKNYGNIKETNRSLHSDLLRIFLECSFVGTFIYNICYFLSVKKNAVSFLLMMSIFTLMIFNHPIGAGTVGNWIIIYLLIVYFNYRSIVTFYKEGMVKRKKIKIGKIRI